MKKNLCSRRTKYLYMYVVVIYIISCLPATAWGQYQSKDFIAGKQKGIEWPKGQKAAISLTFDDGRTSQIDNGIPIFDTYNVKATFYVNPGNIKNRLEKWKAAAANGHEIGNHTSLHPCSGNFPFSRDMALENYTLEKIADDIDNASDSIELLIGIRPSTFAYPCGQKFVGKGQGTKSYVPLIANRFIAGRGWLDEAPNDPLYCDMSQIYGMASDGYDFAHIKKLINQAVESNGWLVLCGHNILPEGESLTTYTSMLEELCAYIIEPENGIWVAPVKNVAEYIKKQKGEDQKKALYLDPNQQIEKRVEDLLSKMTLEEKIGQLNMPCVYVDQLGRSIDEKMQACKSFTKGTFEEGIGPGGGFFGICDEILHNGPRQQAEFVNELQRIAREETRLGIPLFIIEEGTHGFVASGGTIFPEGPAIGSTWNMDLVKNIYSTAAKEARSVGAHQLYTLVIEPNRDPRQGRNMEGYSEDPYLCSRIAENIVTGAQGDDISSGDKLIAGLCHYPGQSQGTGGLERGPMEISERQLREVFLPPWEAGIKKARALGVMATYPSIDGVPAHASEKLLTDILREELGFEGMVVSEGIGFSTLVEEQVVATQKEAGAKSIRAGVDVGITYEQAFMMPLIENVKEGKVHISTIDRAVKRILTLKFKMGLFENPFVDPDKVEKTSHTTESQKLVCQVAREGLVLLKNEGDLLPLDNKIRSIAIIGPNADNGRNQLGDYTSIAISQDIITVLDGIKSKVPESVKVSYVKGCEVLGDDFNEIDKARKVAKDADVAIVVVGENERQAVDKRGKKIGTDGEERDVASLDLTGLQEELIRAVYSTGTPTIVVLINGRPLSINWVAENIPAILEAWIPGEKGGDAIADVLFGDYNPDGRLPITIPRHSGQLPVFYNYNPMKKNKANTSVDYVDMPMSPLYEFGFGLSYTKFKYSDLTIRQESKGIASDVSISLEVQNIGKRKGAEVVQLYINDEVSSVVTPIMELKGFEKIWLEPGEKKRVEFKLTPDDLAFVNLDMKPLVEPGTFKVMVGSSSADIRLEGKFEIED